MTFQVIVMLIVTLFFKIQILFYVIGTKQLSDAVILSSETDITILKQ